MGRTPTVQDPEHALAQLSGSSQVLVLCHGNICRSPLAERLFRTRLRDRGIGRLGAAVRLSRSGRSRTVPLQSRRARL
ncbi:hypothetical protein [Halorientalis brevis]|nr:hypothetical protein [Halorientalis brevis]